MQLTICSRYQLNPLSNYSLKFHLKLIGIDFSFVGEESNMAVMEISLPSGYVMDEDSLPSLRATKVIKKVETKEGGTGISLYFDKVKTPF